MKKNLLISSSTGAKRDDSPPRDGSPYVSTEQRPELGVPQVQSRPRCPAEHTVEQRVKVALGAGDGWEEEGVVVKLQEVSENEQELDGDGGRDEVLGLGKELSCKHETGVGLTF